MDEFVNFFVDSSKLHAEHAPGNNSSYTLKSLRPASRYEVRVKAENLLGRSVASPAVQILTDEEAPSDVPREAIATASSSTSINLAWKPPSPEAHNGLLSGYIVGYRVENSSDAFAYKTVKSEGGKRDETIVLRDLRKYTPYAIVLQVSIPICQKLLIVDWLIDRSVDRLIDWLIGRSIDWLIDRSIEWLIDWLIGWSIDWLIGLHEMAAVNVVLCCVPALSHGSYFSL